MALVLAGLAVFALATVAASLDTVSTEPTVGTEEPTLVPKNESGGGGGGGGGGGTREGQRDTAAAATTPASGPASGPPLWQVAAGLGLFLVGSVAALYGLTRGTDEDGSAEGPPEPQPTAPAADRATLAEGVPATNDVYRAWGALCRAVPLDPAGQTPAAVAEAAVAAGYGAEPVAELTDTFCAIRYGDAAPTGERERRARALAAELSLEGAP